MQNNLLEKTKELCRIYGIQPARSKGQNFLINEDVYDSIVEAAELKNDDIVLEVGPGLGFLTSKLAKKVKQVIAVELDDILAHYLKTAIKTQGIKNVEVVNENILDFIMQYAVCSIDKENKLHTKYCIPNTKYKIVANLPYNITSVFLRKFLSETEIHPVKSGSAGVKQFHRARPEMMVLMLQKEVAERITAHPGEMSLLAISVQFYAEAEIVAGVPRKDFWPAPEVDSAIIKLKLKDPSALIGHLPLLRGGKIYSPLPRGSEEGVEKSFFRLVKIGFSAKRKMLKNNLAAGYHIPQAEAEKKIIKVGLDGKIRAQELSIKDWAKLVSEFGGFE